MRRLVIEPYEQSVERRLLPIRCGEQPKVELDTVVLLELCTCALRCLGNVTDNRKCKLL